MKQKLLTLFVVLLIGSAAWAQTLKGLKVEKLDEQTFNEALSKIARIVFEANGDIVIQYNDESLPSEKIGSRSEGMANIVFTKSNGNVSVGNTTAIGDVETVEFSVYPNPVADHVHVNGLKQGQMVHIFSMEGRLVMVSKDADINMSGLKEGIYLLQAGKQIVKLIKK
ncbi:MAG: T9SS type A sorting domain-containing protein [Bacteroidales bacterium]|nr:T9SS type A sorting domain-containing protein [Bacteroidales bacterium]